MILDIAIQLLIQEQKNFQNQIYYSYTHSTPLFCQILEFEYPSFVYDYQMKHEKAKGFLLPK